MPLSVALTHRTTYRYAHPVALGPQTIRLRPAPHTRAVIQSYTLAIAPKPHFVNWQQDPQGNHLARVVFPERVDHFDVTVDLVADMTTVNPFDFFLEPDAEHFPFTYDAVLDNELAPFRRLAPAGAGLDAFVASLPRERQATVDMLVARQSRRASARRLCRADGTGRVNAGGNAQRRQGIVPRFRLAAGAGPAPARASPRVSSRAT